MIILIGLCILFMVVPFVYTITKVKSVIL
jgi:hypothetical protein